MLSAATLVQPFFDFRNFSAFGFIKESDSLSYEKEQPVEVEYIDNKREGSVFDITRYAFYHVYFLGENVKPEDRERYIVVDVPPLKEGIDKFKPGSVHFLHSFDRQTLDYEVIPPLDIPANLSRTEIYDKYANAVTDGIHRQEVPSWLFAKLADADAAYIRNRYNKHLSEKRTEQNLHKKNI